MQVLHWNDYQAFLAVARLGQLARAAASLGVDATTIGRRIRRLEQRIDQTLFEQTRGGQLLTEAGEKLFEAVENMAQAADRIEDLKQTSSGPFGNLRISVSEGFGGWFLAKHAQEFLTKNPNLQLELVSGSGFLSPSKREADIAVLLSKPKRGRVNARKLTDYALRLYASSEYLDRYGSPTNADDLFESHRLVGYIPDLLYAPELRYLEEFDRRLTASIKSSSIMAQMKLIDSGAGVGILPCFIGDECPGLRAIMPQIHIIRSLWIVTHKDNQTLSRVRAGRTWLTDAAIKYADKLLPLR